MRKEILYTIQRWEGGLTDDKDDPGGLTKFGISKVHHPTVDVKNLTLEGAVSWYEFNIWGPLLCGEINSLPVRWKVFDIGVNLNNSRAARFLQRAVGATEDGIVGQQTIQKANSILLSSIGQCTVMARLIEQQMDHYVERVIEKPSQLKYLRGWKKRAFDQGTGIA